MLASYTSHPDFLHPFVETETLRYSDGREVVSQAKECRLTLNRVASVTHLPGHTHGRVSFWIDHDPRIVAVTYTYAPA